MDLIIPIIMVREDCGDWDGTAPKVLFLFLNILKIPTKSLHKIQGINNFIWRGKRPRIRAQILEQKKGALAIPNIKMLSLSYISGSSNQIVIFFALEQDDDWHSISWLGHSDENV